MIEDEHLLDNCREMSGRIRSHLAKLKDELPIVAELRVRGMMVGLDLTVPAAPAVAKCRERGLLVNATHETVVRLLPAINTTAEQVDDGCRILAEVLQEMAEEA